MFRRIVHKAIFAIIWLCLLISSFLIYDQIGGRGYTILIATPKYGILQASIVEYHNNDIHISYQTLQTEVISVGEQRHYVNIIGTNHSFATIMSYFRVNGDFFTQEALKLSHNVAVLNIEAAITIFGNTQVSSNVFYFENQQFKVVGVIDDRDSSSVNIYIPITSIQAGDNIDAIAIDAGIPIYFNQSEAIALLQDLNISAEDYYKINMFAICMIIRMYHELTVTLFILVIFESITSNAVKIGLRNWRIIAKRNEEELNPWRILFSKSSLAVLVAIGVTAFIFVTIGRESMGVFLNILQIINTRDPFAGIPQTVFTRHIQELAVWHLWIRVVFWVSLITFVTYYVVNFWKFSSPADEQ